MLISRGISVFKIARSLKNGSGEGTVIQPIRQMAHWNYRVAGKPPPHTVTIASAVQGFAWWWILWHLWTQPGHIFGEFEYPDPSQWTDEELGIPSS